ncbi:transcription antiterminator [Bacillus luteolus]|uniref:Transcription antiterminator n=1 Tax=Litchfieldia luteola TaxID=682179 RepID=A0ABR9QKF4_9BACI|nr:transcription antiterminator [Cytobacillus luteolus]MBE4908983.1 transcription antiterminator [Cytobacillus luteolus]MBP1941842.1 transcriptional antiterminator [Cytobacillus luteolus]
MASFILKKRLNNNVIIAVHEAYGEVVLLGKGLGFGKNQNDWIKVDSYEKMFVLKNGVEQEQYMKLLPTIDEDFVEVMNDLIYLISENIHSPIHEHIHIALTDHIAFAIKRVKQGIHIENPFLTETKDMYPAEYGLAAKVVKLLHDAVGVKLPDGEIGFIALHIHSAISNKSSDEFHHYVDLISELIQLIEVSLKVKLDREEIQYLRLARHLTNIIKRAQNRDKVDAASELANLLKNEYPLCYNLSCKVMLEIKNALHIPVHDAEIVYFTMHLQRLISKNE